MISILVRALTSVLVICPGPPSNPLGAQAPYRRFRILLRQLPSSTRTRHHWQSLLSRLTERRPEGTASLAVQVGGIPAPVPWLWHSSRRPRGEAETASSGAQCLFQAGGAQGKNSWDLKTPYIPHMHTYTCVYVYTYTHTYIYI